MIGINAMKVCQVLNVIGKKKVPEEDGHVHMIEEMIKDIKMFQNHRIEENIGVKIIVVVGILVVQKEDLLLTDGQPVLEENQGNILAVLKENIQESTLLVQEEKDHIHIDVLEVLKKNHRRNMFLQIEEGHLH